MANDGMDKDVLGDALWTRAKSMNANAGHLSADENTAGRDYWRGLADEIIIHFKTYAKVTPNTLAITPSLIIDSTTHACTGDGVVHTGKGLIE